MLNLTVRTARHHLDTGYTSVDTRPKNKKITKYDYVRTCKYVIRSCRNAAMTLFTRRQTSLPSSCVAEREKRQRKAMAAVIAGLSAHDNECATR